MFDIPIVLFIFRRKEKSVLIVNQIKKIKPRKLYIIADEGRNDVEKEQAQMCRQAVESAIDWPCEVIKNYANENKGCFERIGMGALWVFEHEDKAIFIEDDNLPEITFFEYCKQLLEKYETNDDVLWICGTNYLESYNSSDNSDYVFTQHMHPCGGASWAAKFNKYYDKDFSTLNKKKLKSIKEKYVNKKLFQKDVRNWKKELKNVQTKGRFSSWDYQMCYSIRAFDKLGIVPCKNQIKNIGVDSMSAHGGTSFESVMTQRFCGMDSLPIEFPLKHPDAIKVDECFERLVDKIEIPPKRKFSIRYCASKIIRAVFNISDDVKIKDAFKRGKRQ